MNLNILIRFLENITERKNGALKNNASITKNTPSIEEIKDSLNHSFVEDAAIQFYFSDGHVTKCEIQEVFCAIKNVKDRVPITTDNGYDYMIALVEAAIEE
jgi:hypothetical protein